ncbi:hypothetical protein JT487_000681 [Salmonella enterica]|nr:hypothetical protein [Salmonella enterica]
MRVINPRSTLRGLSLSSPPAKQPDTANHHDPDLSTPAPTRPTPPAAGRTGSSTSAASPSPESAEPLTKPRRVSGLVSNADIPLPRSLGRLRSGRETAASGATSRDRRLVWLSSVALADTVGTGDLNSGLAVEAASA